MSKFYIIPFLYLFASCASEKSNDSNAIAELKQKMNHLNQEVDSLKNIIDTLQSNSLKDFKID
jgi:cell division protein FtsB